MLYLVLLGALFCLTVKGYSGKRVSCYVKSNDNAFVFNLLRMVFCIIIGFAFVFFEGAQQFFLPEGRMIAICILAGLSNAAFLVFWMLAIRKNSMVFVDVGLTLGSLLPSVLCLVLFDEPFALSKMIGFAIILFATFILSLDNKEKTKKTTSGIILLVLAALGDGMSGFSQQLFKHCYTENGKIAGQVLYPKTIYHFYTYIFSAVVLVAFLLIYRVIERNEKNESEEKSERAVGEGVLSMRVVIHIFVMAVCLFLANYLQTVATADYKMSSQLMYPIIRGGTLVTVNIVAACFFSEKITRNKIIGSFVSIFGIVIMSVF